MVLTRQLTLEESVVTVAGMRAGKWLRGGGRIILADGKKTYWCPNCRKEIRQKSRDKALERCPTCGGKVNALDFLIIVQKPNGDVWYPTFDELKEYFNSAKDRDELYKHIVQIYTSNEVPYVPEHEWFLNYIYFLFFEEDINYPVPIYEGRDYALNFFKSAYEGSPSSPLIKDSPTIRA